MSKYGSPFELSRFLRNSWLKDKLIQIRIHYNAFMPPEKLSELQVSCFETQGLNHGEVFYIATINKITFNDNPPVGYATIHENKFPKESLKLDRNDIPSRHVDIIGWEYYSNKEDRIALAGQLAEIAASNIVLRS